MMHDEIRESLGAYALDSLTAEERSVVEAHLRTCASCSAEMAQLMDVSEQLSFLIIERDPPLALRARLIGLVEQDGEQWQRAHATTTSTQRSAGSVVDRGTDVNTASAPQPAQQSSKSWWQRLHAAFQRPSGLVFGLGGAVLLALIVLGIVLFNRNNVNVVRMYACTVPQALVAGNDFTNTGCTMQVRSNHTIEVAFNNLPTLQPTQAYELWMLPAIGKPLPVTGFVPNGSQNYNDSFAINAAHYAKAAVTIEKAPGNARVPHGPVVLLIPFTNSVKLQS